LLVGIDAHAVAPRPLQVGLPSPTWIAAGRDPSGTGTTTSISHWRSLQYSGKRKTTAARAKTVMKEASTSRPQQQQQQQQ